MFWPNGAYKPDLDMLVAGCGTNQAAVLAYTNPQAKIVAIDVSQTSLNHHQYLKDKYNLKNLALHLLPIEEVRQLDRDFDLIISTGVLHHLADPNKGIQALSTCLRRDGVIALMLYAKYGRIGVEILQSVVRDLELPQDEASILMVRDMLSTLAVDHPIKSYMNIAPDLQFDAGLVDTFLHGRDRSYSIPECIDLVHSADLEFQDLFLKSSYYPPTNMASAFYTSVINLPEQQQWSVMERINFRNACHFFTACRKERSKEGYAIDFSSEGFLEFVPSLRYRCALDGNQLSRYDWNIALNHVDAIIMNNVNGQRTIANIIEKISITDVCGSLQHNELKAVCKALFQRLWQLDFLAIGLQNSNE
jgi:SAM-dependent methyltransferase